MNKLKPCPFCGGEDIYLAANTIKADNGIHSDFYYFCGDCMAEGSVADTENNALLAWNKRNEKSGHVLLPKEPPLKLIVDLYYKGDMEMAIHNKEVTKICIKDYKKALENYAKDNPCNSENTNQE